MRYAALIVGLLAAWPLNTALTGAPQALTDAICLMLIALWALSFAAFRKKRATDWLLLGGFVAGLVFVLRLAHNFSWHDLAAYAPYTEADMPDGHLGYIAWIVEKGLPLMDPRIDGYSVFYNPPLYHLLQAGGLKCNLALGIALPSALENMQLLTLGCASACSLVTADLLHALGLSPKGVRTGVGFVVFQPMLLIFGATLNNDIASVLCVLCCLLFTVRWLNERLMKHILFSGLSLGLGMAVKLSVAVLIPAMAVAFAAAFFSDLAHWKRYIRQFAMFLAVSVPEAVAWPLYHLLAFQMPLSYVRLPAETINVSRYSLWKRYGVPDWFARRGLFFTPTRKTDHNVWMQTLKTGLFDELTLFEDGAFGWYVCYALMALFAGLMLLSLVLFVRWLRKGRALPLARTLIGLYGATLCLNYLKFTLDFPYICTFSFRYIMPLLALAGIAFGYYREDAKGIRGTCVAALCVVFAIGVMGVYGISFFSGRG